ncbi:hypothetical protein N7494_007329 [Penicillium frequentans]|uniref:Glycosyl transferase family 25 domain-containing protein n=1 Tax=Penicillium frequentans TaxID=3151616 RepID=A0AAD6GDE1_9EURO|nr:hypothetical protein N7494_007329 [Penicillium glabrum]
MTLHDPHPQQPELQWSDPEAEKNQEALRAQIALDTQKKLDEQNLWKNLDNIQNATLGFDKVFAINLASRTDKRDNIVLGSSVTGFVVDLVDGVDPEGMNPKSYPYNWNYDHSESEYACRRAHVNMAERIVEKRMNSALILEDDVDWDISIKAQLQNLALATRALQGTAPDSTSSPYGHDWDLLWLGHCGMSCKVKEPYYMTPQDPTVVKPHHLPLYFYGIPEYNKTDDSRLTCTVFDSTCMTAYALSYKGAQKILAALSVNPSGIADEVDTGDQIDIVLGRMCKAGTLRCFAPFPSLMGRYQSAGMSSKGTDQLGKEAGSHMVPASSVGVVYSTMLNIKRILKGLRTVHATWPDVKAQDILPEDIHIGVGDIHPPVVPSEPISTPVDAKLPDLEPLEGLEAANKPDSAVAPIPYETPVSKL